MPEPIFMKLGMYIMGPEPISSAYFINSSHQSVYPPVIARKRLGKNVTAAMNTHTKTKELLDVSFSMWFVSYLRKTDNQFLPELPVLMFETGCDGCCSGCDGAIHNHVGDGNGCSYVAPGCK
jgi:hypothetical protein